jgi:hypothetical protein
MPNSIFDAEVQQATAAIQAAAAERKSKTVNVDGKAVTVPFPFLRRRIGGRAGSTF